MYSIDFGNNNGYFSIEENSGKITLNKIIPLEENVILEFSLQITARDGTFKQYFSQYFSLTQHSLPKIQDSLILIVISWHAMVNEPVSTKSKP